MMSMIVNGVQSPNSAGQNDQKQPITSGDAQSEFANTLKTAIEKINDTQNDSDKQTQALASGNVDDLHNVMIAGQKASITLETSVQMQRKVVDAYNEIMRMQV